MQKEINWTVLFCWVCAPLCKGITLFLPPIPLTMQATTQRSANEKREPEVEGEGNAIQVVVVVQCSRNNPAAGLIAHLSRYPFPSSAACQGLRPYHPPHWFRKNLFRTLWLPKLRPIHRAQQQTIPSLRLTAKRHNHLEVIPAERPSGSNCQVCSNHPQRGPRGSLTKLGPRTPGPL